MTNDEWTEWVAWSFVIQICFVETILSLSPEHHLTPALSPISWRRGRRTASGFFEVCSRLRSFLQSTFKLNSRT